VAYHDDEWGRPVHGDREIFERLSLEAFQSGLSWLTILRKRAAFRDAFAQFDIATVAGFGNADYDRLMSDTGIVRNRGKIRATISNAVAIVRLQADNGPAALDTLVWSFAPGRAKARPRSLEEVAATTPESVALSRALKRAGLVFVGPTTSYAAMQAMGLVDDHLRGCHAAR